MFIDTHCHLDFPDFDADRQAVIERARQEGIGYIINVSSSLKGCLASLELAERYDIIYASIGIHPHEVKEITEDVFRQIEGFLKHKKVVAIGEVGLDFYRNLSLPDIQKEFFARFIGLSISADLPLVIHSRQADTQTLEILKSSSSDLRGVVHCFSGSKEFLKGCLDLGLHISFTCNLTYKKADNLRELAGLVPQERLLLETDCPFLAPQDFRGKRNEPAYVKYLAEELARIRNSSVEKIAEVTTTNAKRLFKLE